MKKLYVDIKTKILEIMLTFMDPTVLTGVLFTSMVGGFNMFASYLFGLCAIALFMKIYTRFV